MSTASQARCVGCGAAVTGRYCADCGEHAEPHDYSIKHFVTEAVNESLKLEVALNNLRTDKIVVSIQA